MAVPSVHNLSKIAVTLNIKFEWLATGRGSMIYEDETKEKEHQAGLLVNEVKSPAWGNNEFFTLYSKLTACQKQALIAFLKAMIST